MSKRVVTLDSGTVVTVEAKYGCKMEFGQWVEDHKHILEIAIAERDGKVLDKGNRYFVESKFAPEARVKVIAAMDDCRAELTGISKAEREAKAADAAEQAYDAHTAMMSKAMSY